MPGARICHWWLSLCSQYATFFSSMPYFLQIERILGVRLQAGLRAWTQVLLGQADDKAEVDMDTDAPQVSHKPGGEPKIKVSFVVVVVFLIVSCLVQEFFKSYMGDKYFFCMWFWRNTCLLPFKCKVIFQKCVQLLEVQNSCLHCSTISSKTVSVFAVSAEHCT